MKFVLMVGAVALMMLSFTGIAEASVCPYGYYFASDGQCYPETNGLPPVLGYGWGHRGWEHRGWDHHEGWDHGNHGNHGDHGGHH